MRTLRFLFCLLCGLLCLIDLQAQVQITSHVIPPYLNRIQDYASQPHLMVVTLTNTSTSEVRVQLTAKITGDNGISAWVKPGYRSTSPIVIQSGQTINLNGNDIAFLFDINKIEYTGISRADMTRGMGLLEGNYTLCIRALQYESLQPISPEQTGCTTIRITDLEPPRILSPFNEQQVDAKGVQAMPITWTTPPGSSPFIQYKLKIVEMVTPRNPNDAIQSTRAHYEETLNSNMLLYGPQYPALVKGRQYAMVVQAIDPMGMSNFRNRGISEVMTFVYGKEEEENQVAVVERDTVLKYPTTVHGRLLYRFAESPESGLFPIANQQVYLEKVYGTYSSENGRQVFHPVNQRLVQLPREIMDSKRVTTDAEGNFELTADLLGQDSSGMVSGEAWDELTRTMNANASQVNMALQRLSLRYVEQLAGNLAVTYRIVVDNPYFNTADNYMDIQPGGVWGLADSATNADMVLDANSFTLAVNVQEIFNNMRGGYSGNQEIRIYRRAADRDNPNLGIPAYEGDLISIDQQPTLNGSNVLVATRKTPAPANDSASPADYTVYFPRLLRNPGGSGHEYHICLVRGGVVVQDIQYNDLNKLKLPVATESQKRDGKTAQTAAVPPSKITDKNKTTTVAQLPKNSAAETILKDVPGNNKAINGIHYLDVDSKQPMANILANLQMNNVNKSPDAATRTTQDKWLSYRYDSRPDTATLTLERELIAAPRSKLTGKLMYAYKNKLGVPQQPYANMRVKLMVFYLSTETPEQQASTNSNSQNSAGGYTAQLANYMGNSFQQAPRYNSVVAALANQDNTQSHSSDGGGMMMVTATMQLYKRESRRISVNGVDVSDNGKILKTTTTDANGNFTFDFDNADSTRLILEGATLSQGSGDLYSSVKGKVQRVYRIVPDVPYYCAPDQDVSVQPWEDKNVGTLVSYVNTYTLEVEVGQLATGPGSTSANSAIAVPDVNVQLYRLPLDQHGSQLPNLPDVDVNRSVNLSSSSGSTTTSSSNGMFMMTYSVPHLLKREAMTKMDGNRSVVVFNDVVVGKRGTNDNYYIFADTSNRLSNRYFDAVGMQFPKTHTNIYTEDERNAPGVIAESPAAAAYEALTGYTFNSELDPNRVARAKLRVKSKGAMISGRVMDEFTQLGLAGVTVTVSESVGSPNGSSDFQFDVVTDANGYFNFTNYSRHLESDAREYASTGGIMNPDEYNWRAGANTYGYTTTMTIHAPGYEAYVRDFGSEIGGDIRFGYKFHDDYHLKPAARDAFGYVVDAEMPNQGVTARVKLKVNGRWVDTYSHSGDPNTPRSTGSSGNYLFDQGYMSQSIGNYLQSFNTTTKTANKLQQQQNIGAFAKSGIVVTMNKATNTATVSMDKAVSGYSPVYTELVKGYIENNNADPNKTKYTLVETAGAKMTNRIIGTSVTDKMRSVGAAFAGSIQQLTGNYDRQRFDIDLPARPDSIIIMPYDPAYMTQTFAVAASEAGQNLGEFKLQRRKHRVNVLVKTASGELVRGAKVAIDGSGLEKTTGERGNADFTFINNSIKNFTIRVFNAGPSSGQSVWVEPMTQSLHSVDENKVQEVIVTVKKAMLARGKVTFASNGTAVSGAIVYVNQGTGSGSDMQTVTAEDGHFELVIPQVQQSGVMPARHRIEVQTAYHEEGKTFIGSQVDLMVGNVAPTEELALTVREVDGIDLSRLHGIPFRVSKLDTLESGQYRVDGELYDLPGNDNFAMRSVSGTHQVLQLRDALIRPSAIRNASGIPYAVVVDDDGEQSVATINRELQIKAYDVFNAQLEGYAGGTIDLIGGGSDTSGSIYGHVHIVDNSFNFPTSYMTIANQDFYLGNYGSPYQQLMKYYVPVFKTNGYARTRFAIHSVQNEMPKPITFKYLGFDGLTETLGERESFVEGDSIVLYMKLSTTIQNNIKLEFNGGTAVVKHDRLSGITTDEPVTFALENWNIKSDSWSLSSQSGGIVLRKGTLQTGKIDLSFTDMQIIPGELICNSLEKGTGLRDNLRIGGEVGHPLQVSGTTEVMFLYDPDVGKAAGKGHYKLTLRNTSGTAATIRGLDGMTRSTETIGIQYVSLLSNGEELFTFSSQQQPVTFYNQIAFTPTNLVSYEDRLILTGTSNLFIPGLSDKLMSEFAFFKDNSNPKGHRLEIRPFRNFTFTGAGGTKFMALNQQDAFQFTNEGYGVAGTVEIPSGGTLAGNLLSMATSALGNTVASAVKKQAEVIIGDGLLEDAAGNFAGKVGDELNGALAEARNQILRDLNEVSDTYNQLLKIGQTGQQIVNDIAGKWRLAGQGLDAINNFGKDPVGSLMQLNGVFEGFTGIDLKEEASQKARLVAQSAIKGFQEEFPVSNMMPSTGNAGALKDGFAGMKFDFDMNAGRITGSLNIKKLEFGAASLSNVGIEMLMDRQGWYFYAGTEINVRSVPLIFPVSAGLLIGYYPSISPELKSRVLSTAYVKRLPNIWESGQQPFSGFFFTGGKDIIPETKIDINLAILSFEVGAHAGFDARLYAKFGGDVTEIGVGAMLFANLYARLSVAMGLAGVEGSITAELAASGRFRVISGDVSAALQACASVTIKGRAWVGPKEASYSEGIGALLTIDSGRRPVTDFSIKLGAQNCSQNPEFDY